MPFVLLSNVLNFVYRRHCVIFVSRNGKLMNYRKSTYKKIILFLLTLAGVVLISLLLLGGMEFKRSETRMQEEITVLFKEAIHEEVELKMKGVYQYTSFRSNPAPKKERIKKQTITTKDTTIIRGAQRSDNRQLEFIKSSQSYLLLVNRLRPDTLQQLFNSKIDKKNIKAHPYVLVRHSDNTMMNADTTGLRLNYRVPVVKGGVFDEISYEAFLSYSPIVVFRMMSKTALVFLFVLELLILSFVFYLYRRLKQENMASTISKLRNVLNSVGCTFNITKIKGSDYYKLDYVEKKPSQFS